MKSIFFGLKCRAPVVLYFRPFPGPGLIVSKWYAPVWAWPFTAQEGPTTLWHDLPPGVLVLIKDRT